MSWVKLDDLFPRHPKVIGLNAEAKWAYIEALCYCAQYRTDGDFPPGIVPEDAVGALVVAGLVEDVDDGYRIHDYLEYNPSRKHLEAKSKSNSKAARKRWADVVASETHSERTRNALGVRGLHVSEVEVQEQGAFDRFWSAYPRKEAKIKAREVFDAAVEAGADPEVIVDAALAYRAKPGRTAKYTALPTTWLNQGRWLDGAPEPTNRAVALADRLEREGL